MPTNTIKSSLLAVSIACLSACTTSPTVNNAQDFQSRLPDSLQQVPVDGPYQSLDFQSLTYMGGTLIAPDNQSVMVYSNQTGAFNTYKVDIETGGVEALAPTSNTSSSVAWFPNDGRALITYDQQGNEVQELFVRELDGTLTSLSQKSHTMQYFAGFSNDGAHLFMFSNHRDPRFMDLYRVDAKTYAIDLLYENRNGYHLNAISPDGRFGMMAEYHGNRHSRVLVVDLTDPDAKPRTLLADNSEGLQTGAGFTSDGQFGLIVTDQFGDYAQAYKVSLATGEAEPLIAPQGEVQHVYYSAEDRYRTMVVSQGAVTLFATWDHQEQQWLSVPNVPQEDIQEVNFSSDGTLMAFHRNSASSPSELHIWDRTTNTVTKLTDNLNGKVDPALLAEAELVRYPSFDGEYIEGVLHRPQSPSESQNVPVVIYIHGGPTAQFNTSFHGEVQYLVSQGFGVFAPNFRGSTGYGKRFARLNDRRHGEDDLQDIVYAKRYLSTLDWVDGENIGLVGGSYGGFLVSAAMVNYPDEFKAGVSRAGLSNWINTLENIPVTWEVIRKQMYQEHGDPSNANDRKRLKAISPLFHADKITKPMLFVQGANDMRVPQTESDAIVAELRKNQVPVEYIVLEDEGHFISLRPNLVFVHEAQVRFLNKYLK